MSSGHFVNSVPSTFKNNASSHLLSGGDLSVNGSDNTKFDIAAGTAVFVDNYTDPASPTYQVISWPAMLSNTLTNLITYPNTFIGIRADLSLRQFTTDEVITDHDFFREYVCLGNIVHVSHTQIDIVNKETHTVGIDVAAALADLSVELGGILRGNTISSSSGMTIQKTSGTFFQIGANWFTDKKNPNEATLSAVNPFNFVYTWRDGAGGWKTSPFTPTIIANKYDNNTTGSTTAPNGSVPNNSWTIQRGYLANNNIMGLQYGQTVYPSLSEAIDGVTTESFDQNPASLGKTAPVVFILLQGNCTSTSDTNKCRIIKAAQFGASGGTSAVTSIQQAYENGSEPEIVLNSTRLGLNIADAASPIGSDLLSIQNNGATTKYLFVNAAKGINTDVGVSITEGTNKSMGVATLVSGTVTVNNTRITANTRIFLTGQNTSGVIGELYVSSRNEGTSFTISSSVVTDTRSVAWLLIEP